MAYSNRFNPWLAAVLFFWVGANCHAAVSETNAVIRVAAANLTSGSSRAYELPGIRILQGLKPDVVAIQEFNYLDNSAANLRWFVNTAFGTNYSYYREAGNYSIPNGVISRYPILASGSWVDVDTGVNDRGFAWARLDIPGTNDLYVVSIHLKASSGAENSERRYAQATNLVNLIRANFPATAWIVVAGDCNVFEASEPAYQHLASQFSDVPIPTDAESGGDADTNASRSERYDYVFSSASLAPRLTATVYGARKFSNGLVFDTRKYVPLADVAPAQFADSNVDGMQHMAVVRSYSVPYLVTNLVVPAPVLSTAVPGVISWSGLSNLVYRVETCTNFAAGAWWTAGTASSEDSRVSFTNGPSAQVGQFFRVVYP